MVKDLSFKTESLQIKSHGVTGEVHEINSSPLLCALEQGTQHQVASTHVLFIK